MTEKKKSRKSKPAREQKSITIKKRIKEQKPGIDINDKDIRTEIFLHKEFDPLALIRAPIRVTHIPTGISAIGRGQGSQVKNKKKAIELLEKKLRSKRALQK